MSLHYIRGFTLIEVLIVMSIFTLISIGAITIISQTDVFNRITTGRLSSVDEGRKILRPLVGEVRSALPSHEGGYMLAQTQPHAFTFFSDIDGDGLIERVRYFVEDETFKKGVITPTGSPLAYHEEDEHISWVIQNVVNGEMPVFEYYDASYDGSTDALVPPVSPQDVRMVKITIQIHKADNHEQEAVSLSTQVSIRNLKDI